MKQQAKLISIEGSDGTGKSTLSNNLAENYISQGKKVKVLHFPRYETPLGTFILECLNGEKKMDPSSFQYLYLADQIDYTRNGLLKDLEEHDYVILDRYKDSNLVYYMSSMPKNFATTEDPNFYNGSYFDMISLGKSFRKAQEAVCEPDYKIILHAEDSLLRQRLAQKKMDILESDIEFAARTNFLYKNLWNIMGHTNATMTMDVTNRDEMEVLEEALSFIESEVK